MDKVIENFKNIFKKTPKLTYLKKRLFIISKIQTVLAVLLQNSITRMRQI